MTGQLSVLLLACLIATGCLIERSPASAPHSRTSVANVASAALPAAPTPEDEPMTVPGTAKPSTAGSKAKSEPESEPAQGESKSGSKTQPGSKTGEAATNDGGESKGGDAESEGDEASKDGDKTDDEKKEEDKPPPRIVLDTEYDDRRVGDEQTEAVRAEMGIVEDPELNRYVQSIAKRLLRYAPPRPFEYEFGIVDQVVPNAFALPGGKIYVSRGLLALVGSEDELAGVLGHEITHAAERHAAARLEISRRINPLVIGWMRAAQIAAYGRDQERDADRGGQILCAKAGYDPGGIATFLRKLDALERYEIGWSRLPFFLATHPTSPERSALASDRASSLEWRREAGIADGRPFGFLSVVDGLVLGEDPAGGLFEGPLFVHPEMRFSIRFPEGWETANTQQAVAAISPAGDAQATLSFAGTGEDVNKVVDEFLEKEAESLRARVGYRREIMLGKLPAVRLEGRGTEQVMTQVGPQDIAVYMQMTFVAHEGAVYRLALTSMTGSALKYRGRATAFAMSFRPLDEAGAHSLEVTRLRIARAIENETLQALSERTRNALELGYTGVLNGLFASTELERGRPIKIGIAEPYLPKPRELAKPDAKATPDANEKPDAKAKPNAAERDAAKPKPARSPR
ncbi:MAG: M48 family metalloprotease [Deltaproteobacteria bacterium]|nr:M48 family metalloprotease [Deltaproteobacteria bacterium]